MNDSAEGATHHPSSNTDEGVGCGVVGHLHLFAISKQLPIGKAHGEVADQDHFRERPGIVRQKPQR
jgi:hypothetical protein